MKYLLLSLCLLSAANSWSCSPKVIEINSINPIDGSEFVLKVNAYKPTRDNNKQVIILPPIGGVTTLEVKYARKICKRGTAAYVFNTWSDDMEESVEDLAVHYRGTLRGLHAVESFLNFSNKETRILGTSLGGVYAGIAAGKFDHIKKVVIIASGTNLSQIMATSSLPGLVELKNKRFKYFAFKNEKDYAYAIKKQLPIEAQTYKDNFAGKELLFIKTNGDSVIAPKYQDELIRLFDKGRKSIYNTKYGHKKGIIMAFLRRSKLISNFLSR